MHIYLHAHYGKKNMEEKWGKKNAEKDLKHRIGWHYFKIMKKCKKKRKKKPSQFADSEINFSIQLIYIHIEVQYLFWACCLTDRQNRYLPVKPNYGTHVCLMFCLRKLVKYSEKASLIQMLIESLIYLFNTSDDACFLFCRSLLIVLMLNKSFQIPRVSKKHIWNNNKKKI